MSVAVAILKLEFPFADLFPRVSQFHQLEGLPPYPSPTATFLQLLVYTHPRQRSRSEKLSSSGEGSGGGGDNSHTSGSRMLTHRPCSLHGHTDTTWGRNQSKQRLLQLAPPFKNCTWISQPRSQNYFLASPHGAQTR